MLYSLKDPTNLSKKQKIDEKCKGNHRKCSKYKHHNKVCWLSSEAALFQHSAVSVGEDHVEQEVEAKGTKEQESCDNSPDLELPHDQERVEVELEGGHHLQLDSQGSDDTGGGVHPGHWGHLKVGLHKNMY